MNALLLLFINVVNVDSFFCSTDKLFQSFISSSAKMTEISVGDKLPSVDLYEEASENTINVLELVRGKRALIFGVPGAFVPGCSRVHLRGFIDKSDELRSKGFHEIICVSVNDPYVLSAWGWAKGAPDKVRILADPSGTFTKSIKMDLEMPELGGLRSRRYSMITENGMIKEIYVEESYVENACRGSINQQDP